VENAVFSNLNITGDDVMIRNVKVEGEILVTGDRVTLDHVTAQAIAISSASDVTVRFSDVGFGSDDAIHITSDRGRRVQNITLNNNYIHDPRVESTGHYDGTQIRGADNVMISCSTYDAGPYQPPFNAAIYLENANGGDNGATIRDNWLRGFGYVLMIDATGTTVSGNKIGGDIHWGTCYLGKDTPPSAVASHGNVLEASGEPIPVCADTP
jgi:hypothetical protein